MSKKVEELIAKLMIVEGKPRPAPDGLKCDEMCYYFDERCGLSKLPIDKWCNPILEILDKEHERQ